MCHYEQLTALRNRADLTVFNDLSGKGDINGKYHLLELFQAGYPVIPTFNSKKELRKFGTYQRYLLKPLDGADSFGIQRVDAYRMIDGKLLLMELEDYNPFLSLDLLQPNVKEQFLEGLCISLEEQINKRIV